MTGHDGDKQIIYVSSLSYYFFLNCTFFLTQILKVPGQLCLFSNTKRKENRKNTCYTMSMRSQKIIIYSIHYLLRYCPKQNIRMRFLAPWASIFGLASGLLSIRATGSLSLSVHKRWQRCGVIQPVRRFASPQIIWWNEVNANVTTKKEKTTLPVTNWPLIFWKKRALKMITAWEVLMHQRPDSMWNKTEQFENSTWTWKSCCFFCFWGIDRVWWWWDTF